MTSRAPFSKTSSFPISFGLLTFIISFPLPAPSLLKLMVLLATQSCLASLTPHEPLKARALNMLRPLRWIDVEIEPVNATLLPNTSTFIRDSQGRIRGQLSTDYAGGRKNAQQQRRRQRAATTGAQVRVLAAVLDPNANVQEPCQRQSLPTIAAGSASIVSRGDLQQTFGLIENGHSPPDLLQTPLLAPPRNSDTLSGTHVAANGGSGVSSSRSPPSSSPVVARRQPLMPTQALPEQRTSTQRCVLPTRNSVPSKALPPRRVVAPPSPL